MSCLCLALLSALTALLALLVVVAVDFLRLPKSRFYTTKDALIAYAILRLAVPMGWFQWRRVVANCREYHKAQERFLLRQIRDNEDTAYGRDHQFGRIHSVEDFRRLHPVTSYSHYAPYVERAEAGDTGAILGRARLDMLACSSGTTGKAKHIPISSNVRSSMMSTLVGGFVGFQPKLYNADQGLFKQLNVTCLPRWRYTSTGLRIGPLSAYLQEGIAQKLFAMPPTASVVDTEQEALYVSLLFGLRDLQIMRMDGGFASGLLSILQFLEVHWQDLAEDVRQGRVKPQLNISEEQRRAIDAELQPDPQRAGHIETECRKGMDGIMERLFPNMRCVTALSSGTSMSLYKQRCLPYLGDIPMLSIMYGSSEAFCGMNMRAPHQDPAYVLLADLSFIEFLPVDKTGLAAEGEEPVLSDQVKIGELYELVVTNCSGFYRYRLGDIVKVVDFYHEAPAIDFQFRAGQMLNVHMEKLSEPSFLDALQTAVAQWQGVTLSDFTCAESVLDPSPRPGAPYYLVFLELEQGDVSQEQRDMIDAALCEQNYVYKSFRVKDAIAPMKVMIVRPDAFKEFRQFLFDTTTAFVMQFKQPRVLRTAKQVDFFMQRVNQ